MILVIDNYDSFTYNLVQLIGQLNNDIQVLRNDAKSPEKFMELEPRAIIISPGPATPDQAGHSVTIAQKAVEAGTPLLGVCLGHQVLAVACGGKIIRAKQPMHGKVSSVYHVASDIFVNLDQPFTAARYHSLTVERESLPNDFEIVAEDREGTIMGIQVRGKPAYGVQFHPESIATSRGRTLLENFLAQAL